MGNSLFIVGTNTDVGKTVVTTTLIAYQQKYQIFSSLGLLKLMQTGTGDHEFYTKTFASQESIEIITPLKFAAPLAPPIAAELEKKTIDLGVVWQNLCQLQAKHNFVLIEGIGGLGSPVTHELTVANIASEWRLPSILVCAVELGAISQIVANVALARSMNIDLRGIILSCTSLEQEQQQENLAPKLLIESLTQIPILGTLPHIQDLEDHDRLVEIASSWDLEIMGLN